jgi:hypothetical protein
MIVARVALSSTMAIRMSRVLHCTIRRWQAPACAAAMPRGQKSY